MKSFVFFLAVTSMLIFSTALSFGQRLDKKILNKQIMSADTLLSASREGADLKLTLSESADFGVMLNEHNVLTISTEGNAGFGMDKPEYRVDVCGSIRASEEIVVETNEWCDYVFEKAYQLESFDDRMNSINENKHLPYIQPEDEILENGMPVNETITGLLRNVEELYLYVEKLEARISELEDENHSLKNQK